MVARDIILRWLELSEHTMEENKDHLTQLDAAIGDADHGINMARGFRRVLEKIPTFREQDVGGILKNTGMALISSVGGASGPLYGTFFLRAGYAAAGKSELSATDLADLLKAGLAGLIERGRTQVGDKTIVDALSPGVHAYCEAVQGGKSVVEALELAVKASEEGVEATVSMQARKGRASYLGERSIGCQDPGATSSHLILRSLLEAVS
jgi:dihydroxyacetone kinase-like protein